MTRIVRLVRNSLPATLLPLAAAATAHAQNLLANPGFETPTTVPGSGTGLAGGSSIGAWLVVGGSRAVDLTNTFYSEPWNGMTAFNAHGGFNLVDLTGPFNTGTSSGVTQTVATVSGAQYLLSFFVGRAQSSLGSGYYSGNSVVDVSIDGGPRVSFINSNAGATGFIDWQAFSYQFAAASASTTVTFFNGTGASDVNLVGLDDVSLTAVQSSTAPEPASWALLGSGLLPALWLARRRRRVG